MYYPLCKGRIVSTFVLYIYSLVSPVVAWSIDEAKLKVSSFHPLLNIYISTCNTYHFTLCMFLGLTSISKIDRDESAWGTYVRATLK